MDNSKKYNKQTKKSAILFYIVLIIALILFVIFKFGGGIFGNSNDMNNSNNNSSEYVKSIESITGTIEEIDFDTFVLGEEAMWVDQGISLRFTDYKYDGETFIATGKIENLSVYDCKNFLFTHVEISYSYSPDMMSTEIVQGEIITSCNFQLPDNFMIKAGQSFEGINFIFPTEAVTTWDVPEVALDPDGIGPSYGYRRWAMTAK